MSNPFVPRGNEFEQPTPPPKKVCPPPPPPVQVETKQPLVQNIINVNSGPAHIQTRNDTASNAGKSLAISVLLFVISIPFCVVLPPLGGFLILGSGFAFVLAICLALAASIGG